MHQARVREDARRLATNSHRGESMIQTIIMPNGVRIESEVEYLDHACLLCDEPAIRLDIPKYATFDRLVDEQWCLPHTMKFWDIAKHVNMVVRLPFRPWDRRTWWKARPKMLWLKFRLWLVKLRLAI